ncbi:flagellar brake protein [Aliiglaciecola sp. 3_MG-2023]|uniref:flagellar brake protein n=1 Tax=Aliiglaciecola sp. 3_MG-2023 TaxID=3062644 RepID=UPI0026E4679B|nr:flagellar brake protein [Aliiglaciecola sp. 3_MG-2023]MDO6693419.1 flagellar brake protein [Aliiglaciecola sp. 3_MG-2023]
MAITQDKAGLTRQDLRKLRAMRPGLALDLQIMAASGVTRIKTEFVGMDSNRFLIIKYPDETRWGNLRDVIYPDAVLVVRYIHEDDAGEVVAFKVKISVIVNNPASYIFTTFPQSLQCHALRSEQRAQAHVNVTVVEKETDLLLFDGLIVDLSSSGCRVSVDRQLVKQKLAIKTLITLAIKNPDGKISELTGIVMNQKVDEIRFYLGVKFEASEKVVEGLLHQLMIA